MDQAKTGQFIAARRRELGLTQRQLAEKLSISDKTVSKWECGGGLPEVGLMLPLCGELGISVNELLAGRRVEEREYKEQAEANMMDLVRQNQENKKRMALSVICGSVTVVAVVALVIIASFLPLPVAARGRCWRWRSSPRWRASAARRCWTRAQAGSSAPPVGRCSCPPWRSM